MTRNPIFNKAVLLLAHPLSLLALAVLALNDFILKPLAPSWITGKLSDFALLFLLPWLALAAAAWLLHDSKSERAAARVVFAGTAAGYTLFKLFPAAGTALYALTSAAGFPLTTRADPGDLLALLVLIPAWRLWVRPAPAPRLARAWLLLPVAALLTLADAAAPDYGITCFSLDNDHIVASTHYGMEFDSRDGGLTWQPTSGKGTGRPCEYPADEQIALMSNPDGPVQYRFRAGEAIERSTDGGKTWTEDYIPVRYNQVRKVYAEKTAPSTFIYKHGPLTAVEEPKSGNVVFAMGLEGVLVRKPDGEYVWAQVGSYTPNPEQRVPVSGYLALLFGEFILAIAAWILVFSTLALVYHHKRVIRIIKVIIGWLGWLAAVMVFPPAMMTGGYSGGILMMSLSVLGIYALISLLDDLISLSSSQPAAIPRCGSIGLLAGVLFLLPYILWAAEIIPAYSIAMTVAVIAAALVLASGLAAQILRKQRRMESTAPNDG